jgi:phosphate transport system substrate-binding protein
MRLTSLVLVGSCSTALGCFADAREFGEVLESASGGIDDDDDSSSESGTMAGLAVEGSDAVAPILQALVPEFTDTTDVAVDLLITESNFAVDAVGTGRAEVGLISRDMTDVEIERYPDIVLRTFALDGIAVVVNVDNPIDAISLEQLADIYSGRATSWMHVGGEDMPVVVYSRPPASEIGRVFGDAVLGTTPLREDVEVLDSSGQMETAVNDDVGAIAYIGSGVVGSSVKTVTLDGVMPDAATIQGGSYPITRPFHVLTDPSPSNEAEAFVDFLTGPLGDDAVIANGFLPAP